MVQQPSTSTSSPFDVTQWFSVLSEEALVAPTWKELHDYVMSWEERAASSPQLPPHNHRFVLLYSVNDWMEYIERLDDMIITMKTTTTPQKQLPISSVAHFDHLLQLLHQARDWVGRRAVSHLPRSYKLWKSTWEFHISSFQKHHGQSCDHDHCRRVLQCFEQALLTLSHCPRVWVAYLQFVLAHPVPVLSTLSSSMTTSAATTTSISYHTHVRRLLNRALQSLPLTQHDKLWSDAGIIDYCFQQIPPKSNDNPNHDDDHENEHEHESESENNPNNMDIDKTSHHESHGQCCFWPFSTLNRILCRYAQFRTTETTTARSSSFPMDYATWCEQHEQYASAAAAYVAILNSYHHTVAATETTTDTIVLGRATDSQQHQQQQRDVVFQSLMELVAQHADALSSNHQHGTGPTTTITIPWETIVQTTIQNEIQQQQQHADDVRSADSKTIRFLGMLYTWYASAYIQRGEYDMARSIYEEGLLQVMTVRDFTILYTAYLSFLEGLIQVLYDNSHGDEAERRIDDPGNDNDGKHNNYDDGDWDLLLLEQHDRHSNQNNIDDIEMAMLRAEYLIQRRALLLNAVQLRQNPNDAATYLERCELLLNHHKHNNIISTDSPKEGEQQQQVRPAITTLQDGLHRITNGGNSSSHENGSSTTTSTVTTIGDLVLRLVRIYEETLHDIGGARQVFHSVCVLRTMALGIVSADELAICWTKYIEFELKHEQYDTALSLARQSIAPSPASTRNKRNDISGTTSSGTKSIAARSLNLTKSLRLWDLLLDLEESLGTVQTTKDAYNRAIEIKAATVHHILNFASYLMEHQYYEESFTAYERGIELFAYPHPGAKLLWKAYIDSFIKRYKGTKVERVRNLFARCLEHCPASDCAEFFMLHGPYEEEYGLSKRALSVYKEMCEKVPVEDMYTAYQIFITKTIKHRGIIATRDIYQDAIEKLAKVHPQSVVKICVDFAQMEVKLNQIDRARAIYVYGAQSADPRRIPEYWKGWNDFEIEFGSEDTFREMLRVKRSVEAAFSTINYNAVGMTQNVSNFTNEEAMSMIAAAEGMEYIDTSKVSTTATPISGFVPATSSTSNKRTIETLDDVEARVAQLRKVTEVTGSANPTLPLSTTTDHEYIDNDEIDLDELDAEIAEAATDGAIGNVASKLVNEPEYQKLSYDSFA